MSKTPQAQGSATRSYRLGKRAEKQQETRRRIVEAAVKLHGTLGPARTSVAQIANSAGVQRHTFYAHFPDDRSLSMACSGLVMERDPLPDVESWSALPPGAARIKRGLQELYCWYARNEQLTACVLRDAEFHDLTREIAHIRMGPTFARARELLGVGLGNKSKALLEVALEFATWRSLRNGYPTEEAAALMCDAIVGLSRASEV